MKNELKRFLSSVPVRKPFLLLVPLIAVILLVSLFIIKYQRGLNLAEMFVGEPTGTTVTKSLTATADTFVQSDAATTIYGTKTYLRTRSSSPARITYLKFDTTSVKGLNITKAVLRLRVTGDSSSSVQRLYKLASSSWTESTTSYNSTNRPTLPSSYITTFTPSTANTYKEINITNTLKANTTNTLSLAITSTGTDTAEYYSRNNTTSSSYKPTLIVSYTSSVPLATPTPNIGAQAGCETRLTTDGFGDINPDIDGDWVVWETGIGSIPGLPGYGHIHKKNLQTGVEDTVTSEISTQLSISGEKVVMAKIEGGSSPLKWLIYWVNVTSSSPPYRVDTAAVSSQTEPAVSLISGYPWVVWTDNRNGNTDIYAQRAPGSSDSRTQITTDTNAQSSPAIYGTKVVWQDYRNGNYDIYTYDIANPSAGNVRLTTNSGNQTKPAISGNFVVWQDDRNGNSDIYSYDLNTGQERRITTNSGNDTNPDISGTKIVWSSNRNGNYGIYLYDLSIPGERLLVGSPTEMANPAISGNKIVWQDKRNGNFDIYLYDISVCGTPSPTPCNSSTVPLPATGGLGLERQLPYYNYGNVAFYLIGKQNNDAILTSGVDYVYCGFNTKEGNCTGPDRPYLLMGLNDLNGTAKGTYPASFMVVKIGVKEVLVAIPGFTFSGTPNQRYYFYVAQDGSVYHANSAKAPVMASSWTGAINLSPAQAFQSQYLAATACSLSRPNPPSGLFTCNTGSGGSPTYVNAQLNYPGKVYLFGLGQNAQTPISWCPLGNDLLSGNLLVNTLYSLYGSRGHYRVLSFNRVGNTLTFGESDPMSSSANPPTVSTPFRNQTSFDLSSITLPSSGTGSLSGTTKVNSISAPFVPIVLYNVDTQNLYTAQSNASYNYQLTSIPSGRYIVFSDWYNSGVSYTYANYISIRTGTNNLYLDLVLP